MNSDNSTENGKVISPIGLRPWMDPEMSDFSIVDETRKVQSHVAFEGATYKAFS